MSELKTRKQYIKGEISHEDYYAQFVDHTVFDLIDNSSINPISSEDDHFNDIPLARWDGLAKFLSQSVKRKLAKANETGGYSLSDKVCVLKNCARQIRGW